MLGFVFKPNVAKVRIDLEKIFFEYMKEINFSIKPELPIISPENDKSLYFTNSTIVNFKEDINNNSVTNQSTRQKCLRLHNMSKILREDFKIEWPSYFNMLGLIARPENGSFIKLALLRLLIEKYKIDEKSILFMASRKHIDLYDGFPKKMLIFDTHENSYYDWTYHMPDIYGEGLTFSIKQKDNTILDVGNLIQIKKNSEILCYEIAYGIECLDWAMNGKKSLFHAYSIFDKYDKKDYKLVKIIDTIFSITAICSDKIIPTNKSSEGQILKKLYKNLVYLSENRNINDLTIFDIFKFLSKTEFNNSIDIEKAMDYYLDERQSINKNRVNFLREKDKLINKYNNGHIDYNTINKMLINVAEGKFPISPHEREKYMFLERVKS